ncbi:MAG: succinylglutamate desuccinylase/aspartoacylase family protein [Verrucomicrobia bacterium]|nr:succinylglutamate desuccinylase/aspartoacylase family protein [Verrucomicrobiota bacterium]
MKTSLRTGKLTGLLLILVAAVVAALAAPSFMAMRRPDALHPGAGVTQTTQLSAYFPALAGTPGDTPVYILNGAAPGGCMLVLGGTHGDESAGYLTAVILLEQAKVEAGRLIVIPRANASGFTHNVPQEGHPQRFAVSTPRGPRTFTFGARVTNPVHQWPDPQVYTHAASGQTLSGIETRNLNRAYPGRPNGTLTERIAFGITELIRREKVDLAIDLHEAAPEYPVVNTIVAHERASDLAALVNMNLQAMGVAIGMEASPKNLHGLSHREWGDGTPALAVLMEATHPAMGRLRGRTSAELVTVGKDKYYVLASERHRLSAPFSETGWPLDVRVGRHLAGVCEFARSLGEIAPDKKTVLSGLPEYQAVVKQGVGAFLN